MQLAHQRDANQLILTLSPQVGNVWAKEKVLEKGRSAVCTMVRTRVPVLEEQDGGTPLKPLNKPTSILASLVPFVIQLTSKWIFSVELFSKNYQEAPNFCSN